MTNKTIEINVCLQNLGKYNEGELVFEWLSLPATNEEIAETLNAIGINAQYEEFMIADYEAPFSIGEYDNVYKINEIAEKLEGVEIIDFNNNYAYNYTNDLYTIKQLASELDLEEFVSEYEYYTMEEVEEFELYPVNEDGKIDLARMYHFLGNTTPNTEIVRINGYGNLEELFKDDLEELQKDIINEFVKNI